MPALRSWHFFFGGFMKNIFLKILSFLFIGGFFLLMPSISSYAFDFTDNRYGLPVSVPDDYNGYSLQLILESQYFIRAFYYSDPLVYHPESHSVGAPTQFYILNYMYDVGTWTFQPALTNFTTGWGGSGHTPIPITPSYTYNDSLPDIKVSAVLSGDNDYLIDYFDNFYCYLTINDNPTQPFNHYDFYKITIEGEKKADEIKRNYLQFIYSFNLRDYSDSMVKVKVTPYKGTEYGNTIQLFIDLDNDRFTKYTGTPIKPNVTVPTPEGDKQVPIDATTNITYYYSSSTEFITSNFNEYVSYQQTVNVFNENNIDNSVENITNNNYEYFVTNNYYYTYNYDIDIDIDVSGNQLGIKDFINGFPSFGESILNRLTELGFPKWLVVLVISCFGLVVGALVVKIIRSFLPF